MTPLNDIYSKSMFLKTYSPEIDNKPKPRTQLSYEMSLR